MGDDSQEVKEMDVELAAVKTSQGKVTERQDRHLSLWTRRRRRGLRSESDSP